MDIASSSNAIPLPTRILRLQPRRSALVCLPVGGAVALLVRGNIEAVVDVSVGCSALVCAGSRHVDVLVDRRARVLSTHELHTLLAFHDYATSYAETFGVVSAVSTVVALPCASQQAQQWVIQQLMGRTDALGQFAAYLRSSEIYQVVRFVLSHPNMNVQQLAARYGLSLAQFRRLTTRAFGRPLKERLRLLRASRALQQCAQGGDSLTTVAHDTGYASASHLCCDIKALLGCSPRTIFQRN